MNANVFSNMYSFILNTISLEMEIMKNQDELFINIQRIPYLSKDSKNTHGMALKNTTELKIMPYLQRKHAQQ